MTKRHIIEWAAFAACEALVVFVVVYLFSREIWMVLYVAVVVGISVLAIVDIWNWRRKRIREVIKDEKG